MFSVAKKKEITVENFEKDKRLKIKLKRWTPAGWYSIQIDFIRTACEL